MPLKQRGEPSSLVKSPEKGFQSKTWNSRNRHIVFFWGNFELKNASHASKKSCDWMIGFGWLDSVGCKCNALQLPLSYNSCREVKHLPCQLETHQQRGRVDMSRPSAKRKAVFSRMTGLQFRTGWSGAQNLRWNRNHSRYTWNHLGTCLSSILEFEPSKRRPFPFKTRVIQVRKYIVS